MKPEDGGPRVRVERTVRPCCADWECSLKDGTDNEQYESAVSEDPDCPGKWVIGVGMGHVKFCPWCGVAKS